VKAQIQIIIALVVVSAVMFSSLYFISATNARFYTRPLSFLQVEWIALDKELNTLALLALKTASTQADQNFTAGCPDDKIIQGQDFTSCLINANTTFYNTANQIVNNWIRLKMKEGYFIYFNNFKAEYKTDTNYGYVTVAFNVTIYNQLGEYRVFTKNATAYITISFDIANTDVTGNYAQLKNAFNMLGLGYALLTYSLNTTAIISLNGVDMYYVMTPGEVNYVVTRFNGWIRNWIVRRGYSINLNTTMPALYYEGNGVNYVVVGIILDDDTVKTLPPGQLRQLIVNMGQIPFSVIIDGIPIKAKLIIKQ